MARLGWSVPVRSTALRELQRGVSGDPGDWCAGTGIAPLSLGETLQQLSATVQEKWFARLFLAKALVLTVLVLFWISSGLIGLAVSRDAAAAILTARGVAPWAAMAVTVAGSLGDIVVGTAIAFRRTCGAGLLAGMALALAYLAGATILAPALWLDPLGAMVKTVPAIVLMGVALAMLENR
jgi:hypothetical protein